MSIQRPRNETINKVLNLIYLISLSRKQLERYAKVKPIIV